MNNASLTKIVTVKTYSTTADGLGGLTQGASTNVTKRADVRNLKYNERLIFGGDKSINMVVFIMRYFDLDKTSTITYNGVEYKIESVENDNENRFMSVYGSK